MNAGTFVTVTVVVSSAAAGGWVHGEGDTTAARKGEGKARPKFSEGGCEEGCRDSWVLGMA